MLLFSACGIKSPPLTARMVLPDRVSEPSYHFMEDGSLEVTFKPPVRNVQGDKLTELGGFFVERSENRITPDFCAGCPVKYTERLSIEAKRPPVRLKVADVPYSYKDELKPGYAYYYRIYAHDKDGQYEPNRSRKLVVNYDSPVRPPDAIHARSEENMVNLEWRAPEKLVDGRPAADLAGYDLFRREPDGKWEKLNKGEPIVGDRYRDTTAANEKTYEYRIRSVRVWRETRIDGPSSEIVLSKVVDLTPPPPPVNVYCVSYAKGIKLTWPAVDASDLAGYRVYRRGAGSREFKRIGPPVVPENLYLDATARPGRTYYYRITAVDKSPAANESEPSREVDVYHHEPIEQVMEQVLDEIK